MKGSEGVKEGEDEFGSYFGRREDSLGKVRVLESGKEDMVNDQKMEGLSVLAKSRLAFPSKQINSSPTQILGYCCFTNRR